VDWLYSFSFLLYLFGSSLTHIEHGSELSLWLMTFSVVLTMATTLLPILGIRWLGLSKQGSQAGYWVAMLLQMTSWMTYSWAMFLRLSRNLEPFYSWITVTTILWGSWLLIFIFSRHAFQTTPPGDG
jgi:hypothetical protein